jgi:hypothetical protein
LIASVGPLLVPGWSKNARTSAAALFQGAAEASDLDERCRDAAGDRVDYGLHQLPR